MDNSAPIVYYKYRVRTTVSHGGVDERPVEKTFRLSADVASDINYWRSRYGKLYDVSRFEDHLDPEKEVVEMLCGAKVGYGNGRKWNNSSYSSTKYMVELLEIHVHANPRSMDFHKVWSRNPTLWGD